MRWESEYLLRALEPRPFAAAARLISPAEGRKNREHILILPGIVAKYGLSVKFWIHPLHFCLYLFCLIWYNNQVNMAYCFLPASAGNFMKGGRVQ